MNTDGANLLYWELVNATPAPADTITFNYQADIAADIEFNPLVVSLVQNYLDNELELDIGTLPTELDIDEEFTGDFTVPSNPAQFLDGDITLAPSLLENAFDLITPELIAEALDDLDIDYPLPTSVIEFLESPEFTLDSTVTFLDDLFNVELDGTGTLAVATPVGTSSTNFDFNYNSQTNSILIDGFDPDVANDALTGTSTITAEGDFTVDVVLSSLLELDLPGNVASGITLIRSFGINELEVASGDFDLILNTTPVTNSVVSSTTPFPAAVALF